MHTYSQGFNSKRTGRNNNMAYIFSFQSYYFIFDNYVGMPKTKIAEVAGIANIGLAKSLEYGRPCVRKRMMIL
jgi:hypothetical protein